VLLFLPHTFGGVEDGVKLLDFGLVKEVNARAPFSSPTPMP
jgi:hypothetical protein